MIRDMFRDLSTSSNGRTITKIGEVLAGRDPGRCSDEQRIIDYNYGLALHDVVYAAKIYEKLDEDSQEIIIEHETAKFGV